MPKPQKSETGIQSNENDLQINIIELYMLITIDDICEWYEIILFYKILVSNQ